MKQLEKYNHTTMKTMKNTFLIIALVIVAISSNLFAVIETNKIFAVPAQNGSIVLDYLFYDTCTLEYFSGPTTILDKKGNKLLDFVRIENLSNYHAIYFDGKILVIKTEDEVTSDQVRILAFKVSKKGLKKLNDITFDDAKHAKAYGKLIGIHLHTPGLTGLAFFNNKLSNKLFEIPLSTTKKDMVYPNGIIAEVSDSGGNEIVKYTKKGKPLYQHSIPQPATGDLRYEFDDKGGLLYWVRTGSGGNYTNSPLTYVNGKGKKILDNSTLDGVPIYWYVVGWNTKYLYLKANGESKVLIYKIGKKTAKVNESSDPPMNDLTLEKSKVYNVTKDGLGNEKVAEYDKTMSKKKWESPYYDHLDFLGKGVFWGQDKVDNGTGYDITDTIFKGKKNLATHNYYEPY